MEFPGAAHRGRGLTSLYPQPFRQHCRKALQQILQALLQTISPNAPGKIAGVNPECNVTQTPLTVKRWSWLKRWGVEVARRRGKMRAQVAVARRLAVIMHRMWLDGTPFRWTRDAAGEAASA